MLLELLALIPKGIEQAPRLVEFREDFRFIEPERARIGTDKTLGEHLRRKLLIIVVLYGLQVLGKDAGLGGRFLQRPTFFLATPPEILAQ